MQKFAFISFQDDKLSAYLLCTKPRQYAKTTIHTLSSSQTQKPLHTVFHPRSDLNIVLDKCLERFALKSFQDDKHGAYLLCTKPRQYAKTTTHTLSSCQTLNLCTQFVIPQGSQHSIR